MAVHVVRYESASGRGSSGSCPGWGVLRDGSVFTIAGEFPTTGDFIRGVRVGDLHALVGPALSPNDLRILSPITRNQRFVCQGANYRQHMIESGVNPDDKKFNMIFTKASSCIVPADSDVVRPPVSSLLDYELELGLVIKTVIDAPVQVNAGNLDQFVAGMVMVNDITARDIQLPQMQFHKGKSFRTFGPVGPTLCLLEPQDMHYLDEMQLTLTVNGQGRQTGCSDDLVFKPAETLTELSSVLDLDPGDLLSTGTPSGCALSVPPPLVQRIAALLPEKMKWELFAKKQASRPQYLKPGDRIESRILSKDGHIDLGVQRNLVVQG